LGYQALKARDKKGFTLIEVIVVLVILAILAAIAIPALTGYIDKANQRAAISQATIVRTALQSISSDSYTVGADGLAIEDGSSALPAGYSPISGATTVGQEIRDLTGTNVPADNGDLTGIGWAANGRTLTGFVIEINGYEVTYETDGDGNSGYTVGPATE
jgi:type IV pilus assembly protein PilA